jgi:CRP/FNR family transcriptional regulator, anaerobic regulatory protein
METYLQNIGLTPEQCRVMVAAFSERKSLKKIERGMLRHFYYTEMGDEVTRWISLKENFITSVASFITRQPAEENIQAVIDTDLWLIHKDQWAVVYENNEFVRQMWLQKMEENYIGMEQRVYHLIALSAEARYQWMIQHQPDFIKYVPDKYLAAMLGITPRHLSRLRGMKYRQMSS